jgi:hypothetical protein
VGSNVKWENLRTKAVLKGKIIGEGTSGKLELWKIEKDGKNYFVPKERVKRNIIKKPKPPAKKAEPKPPAKKPAGFLAGPKLPPRNDGGSGGTGKKPPEKKEGKVQILMNGNKSNVFDTIKKATDHIQKRFSSNFFGNLRIYGNMEKALAEGREVGFKVKFMLREEKSKREEAGKDKPSDDNVTVTPYYTNADGSTTDTRKTIAKVMDTRKYKVDPSSVKIKPSDRSEVPMRTIVIKVKNFGRGVNRSVLSGWKKLSQQEVFGAKSKPQPANIGSEYYLKEVTTQAGRNELKELSMGYPSEITFFSISSVNKKFGLMGEKNISHSSIRSGDY